MLLLTAWLSTALAATPWSRPPPEILEVLDAPEIPSVSVNPTRDVLLLLERIRYPPLADRAAPMEKLAGIRVDPRTNGFHGWTGSVSPTLLHVDDGASVAIPLPDDLRVLDVAWTADGARFALTVKHDDHIGLWVGDTAGALEEIEAVHLNPLLGGWVDWMPDQERLIVKLIDPGRGQSPPPPLVPEGPLVRVSDGETAATWTYEARDLLTSAHDEQLFSHFSRSQIALVEPSTEEVTVVGSPDHYASVSPSPNGRYLLVTRLTPPWSTTTTWRRFAHEVEVWTTEGELVAGVASVPLQDAIPVKGVATGPRRVRWRQSDGATLVWIEALDGGDPGREADARDRLVTLTAPFTGEPQELFRAEHRIGGVWWGARKGLMLVEQIEHERRWRHVWTLNANTGPTSARRLFDLSYNDRYADPGNPLMQVLPNGAWVLQQVGHDLFFVGQGGTDQGDRPFLDRRSLKTGRVERLFRSEAAAYEWPLALVDSRAGTLLIRRESPSEVPNVHLATLGDPVDAPHSEATFARTDRPVTTFDDPLPHLREIQKRIVRFSREDGTPLSFTLYLPPGYEEGTPLPTVLYAYPREFSDPGTAGQVAGSQQTFDRIGGPSHLFFVLQGYAVLHRTTMPVIGDSETAYDTFVEQLVANAEAAIGEAVRLGVTDPDRVGVMGHSHGGLMAATLIAHSDLFRAGIARSGAYNHTIRPFGFQNERRTFWEARETYLHLSPALHAPDIDEPLLIVHGAIDENPGTIPFQSDRLFEAIRGTGGVARLVMLPFEGHGYRARESVEHVLAEQLSWFDRYVKRAEPTDRARSSRP